MADYPRPFGRYDGEDDEEEDDEEDAIPKIRIGVCAMSKKTNSQPMQEILGRMSAFDCVDIFVFPDDTILNVPVEEWPICDCLISFYSKGFPLEKAIEYAKLRKPFSLNDLEMQYALMDRPTMYSLLKSEGIETPRHAILLRDDDGNPINTNFVESDDSVQIGDVVFQKPFVEKPVNAEDHNVYIYYPSSAGGGSQRLFRKVGNRSSVYSGESSVRKKGSYIYEDFVVTDGTDVKVYTVGPEYAHAEARKSPSLDGKVERDSQGKEIRYPVILNQYEKELANKVCNLFKQTVCGCDLLRTHGKSYVCDVNGFSFVKTSKKYYDDAGHVLMSLIVHKLAPQLYTGYILDLPEETPTVEPLEGTMLELRCVIGIIRHGDRTPKQKMKMEVRHPRFIELFKKYNGFDEHKLKLKRPTQLQEVLNIARDLLANIKEGIPIFESRNKLHQLKSVLEMYGYFSGINRKVQFKYIGKPRDGSESESSESRLTDSGSDEKSGKKKGEKEAKNKDSTEVRGQSSEESQENEDEKDDKLKVPVDSEHALLLIVKWGGELTTMGKEQALQLGRAFRSMYPGGQGRYSMSGIGLLRLHSTYRHDLKIYASDEGRVQMTAAAFAKGFLALEGELTPVLVHLVRSDKNTTEMLDTSSAATKILGKVKHRLHDMLHSNEDFKEDDFTKLAPTKSPSVIHAMKFVKNPYKMCEKLYNLVANLTGQLKELISQKTYDPRDPFLYHDETLELMMHRWTKLEKDFKLKSGQFDISLIPDIYECIKYDVQHNSNLCLNNALDLYKCAKAFADIVIPQEYGITMEEKLAIAQRVCVRLLRKIRGDLRHADKSDIHTRLNPSYSQSVETPHRHVRTRLYFTSESHVHTVLNAFRFGKLFEYIPDSQWQKAVKFLSEVPELNYMTQIVLLLYEDPKADPLSENRFHVEMHFSPGAKTMDDPEFLTRSSPTRKRSEEDVRVSSAATGSTAGNVNTMIRGVGDDGHQSQDSLVNTTSSISNPNSSSSPCVTATSAHPGQSQTTKKTESSVDETAQSTVGSSAGAELNSTAEEVFESGELEPYDEIVYAGNERPRFSIGMEDYSDSAIGEGTGDSTVSSGTSIDDSSGEEKPLKRQRNSLSETEISPAPTEIERRSKDQEASSIKCIEEEDDSKPQLASRRPKAHSLGGSPDEYGFGKLTEGVRTDLHTVDEEDQENEYGSNDDDQHGKRSVGEDDDVILDEEGNVLLTGKAKPSSAKSDTSSVRPRKVSFDVVRDQGKSDLSGQPLKVVHSTPSLKKGGSPRRPSLGTKTSSIRAVRNLSYAIQSALVVKPYSVTKSTKNSRKPPIADFYEEMTKVESLNPLRTLHNAIPLREMDNYFDKTTDQNYEALHTPVSTPSRKAPSKKLAANSSNPTQLLAKMSGAGSEVVERVEDMVKEKIEDLDS
ncbi:Inositol hexakisphosphate and diphosphoinositol-pentakisphosphate kinase 2 [Stylophora pistillata]|uniref:Inositol hexakisphosphate and diphosphoinositol-pentakisphosphate kinase n=1 Tax=Stylophora pistillata TaxID=50429 RepID=A0A2B4RWM4_STYPI|nr:Inositol hexakisphosphate and diphosphoinositol-pentakisphosphate kinase 2 [Stylophora pistillata]